MSADNVVVEFFEGAKKRVKLNLQYAVGAMSEQAKAHCEDMISARDHTLADLAAMGHPYAKRQRTKRIGQSIVTLPAAGNPHDPPETVHAQSGDLVDGLRLTPPKGNVNGVSASVINTDPIDPYVQLGTYNMIARPYMQKVRELYGAAILAAGRKAFLDRLARAASSSSGGERA